MMMMWVTQEVYEYDYLCISIGHIYTGGTQ